MTSINEDERAAKAKAITRAYNKMYANKNRERIREKARARYLEKREELLKQTRVRAEAWQKEHPEATKEHKRRYREKNRENLREANRRYIRDENGEVKPKHKERSRQNNVKHATKQEMLAGRPRPKTCEVCGDPPDKGIMLHFDHCHTHGHFRGWLCRGCNLILGYAKDEPARLAKLIDYLNHTAYNPDWW